MVKADVSTLLVIGIVFLGTLIRSSLGFGEALIAVPLLALFMPVEQAAPVAVLVSIAIALLILLQDWRKVHFRSAGWLILSTLFGIPCGLFFLRTLSGSVVKAALALVIIAFSAYALFNHDKHRLEDDRLAWIFGFLAGVLGGAYGMNGPPLAMYGSLRRWRPDHFRATLQAYFFPASLAGMAAYGVAGLWTHTVTHLCLLSLPGVALAVPLGRAVNGRIQPGRFTSFVYAGLIAIGAILLYQSLYQSPAK
jgi:uncharacterized membrane protein YfcA